MANVKVWGMLLMLGFTGSAQATGLGNVTEAAGASDAVPAGNRGLSPIIPVGEKNWAPSPFHWLSQVKADLNLTQGEVTMFIPDMPNVPPQDVPVMIAQAKQAQSGDTTKVRTLGVCAPSPNHNYSLENVVIPITEAGSYLEAYENRTPPAFATTAIVQQPKHGVLRLVTQADVGTILPSGGDPVDPAAALYFYLPDSTYVGNDTATIEVDFGDGLKVNVKYFFQAVDRGGLGDDWAGDYCSKTGVYWKISSNLSSDGTNTITTIEYQSPTTSVAGTTVADTAALASTFNEMKWGRSPIVFNARQKTE